MKRQLTRKEYAARCDEIVAHYSNVAEHATCASQNAEQAMIEIEGLTPEEARDDLSQEMLDYFAMSMEGFAEDMAAGQ